MSRLRGAPAPADLAARVMALAGAELGPADPVAVAVSGGADSLALLGLAAEAFAGRARALTFDHGLRAGSAAEAQMVAGIAAALGLSHATLGPVPLPPGPGLQAAARQARYAAFARWCRAHAVPVLLTAHHADDQAETLLLRLGRGAGLAGLAGIRACQRIEGLLIVRPLLDVRREALRALVAARGWVPAEDPSNADPRFDRARVRRLLEGTEALDPVRVAASADHLAEAEAAIAWAVARAFESRFRDDRLDLDGLPRELARRLLARAFEARGVAVRGEAVARLLDRGQGTLGGVSARGAGNIWTFRAAPPRRVRQGQTRP